MLPSIPEVIRGEVFSVEVVAEDIPAEGLGAVQFRIDFEVTGKKMVGFSDLGQADPGDIAVASPLLNGVSTSTRSGIGDFFWEARGPYGILFINNETIVDGSEFYTALQ